MKLLMATYNFPPEAYGGTEVYVEALAHQLSRQGHSVEVVYGARQGLPAGVPSRFVLEADSYRDLRVWRLRLADQRFSLPELYATRAADLDQFWGQWLAEHSPDVLHMHGHSLAISNSLLNAARELGIPVMFTFHHATVLCSRGDYITFRGQECDGRVELRKCTECAVATRSGSAAAGAAVAALGPLLARLPVPARTGGRRWRTALHFPALLRARLQAQAGMLSAVSLWHVFSEWTRAALAANGVPPEKIVLRRHPAPFLGGPRPAPLVAARALRVGFFGRFHPVKGLPLLLEAMSLLPSAPIRLEVYGQAQDAGEEPLARLLAEAAARDRRIRVRGSIDYHALPAALAELDVVVVPSLGIETGPLTVLEAFAAGLPVVGSDLSGINEWVRNGHNGLLFARGDVRALAACLDRLCRVRESLAELRHFPSLESIEEHSQAMLDFYRRLAPVAMVCG